MTNRDWAVRIREIRIGRGLTRWEVAEKMGVSYKTISRWEGSAFLPAGATKLAAEKFYGIPVPGREAKERTDE